MNVGASEQFTLNGDDSLLVPKGSRCNVVSAVSLLSIVFIEVLALFMGSWSVYQLCKTQRMTVAQQQTLSPHKALCVQSSEFKICALFDIVKFSEASAMRSSTHL